MKNFYCFANVFRVLVFCGLLLFPVSIVPCGTILRNIEIQWLESLSNGFFFTEEWSYNGNVFLNDFGQLVCDGLCDDALTRMCDENGKIFDDSLERYYQLLDTTRYYHTLSSEAKCYEWLGADFAFSYRVGDTVKCYTACNEATHSALLFSIVGDRCIVRIELNSISPLLGLQYFESKSGLIKIDKTCWNEDVLKAEFYFTFADPENPREPMWWKGRIYTKIEK
ncbi:MAG: hypothetical protein LBN74_10955 [Prevotella sp.]|jgi:hypothetical protein|nr:hypothetical protein [Prevotella sp.]